MCEAAQRNKPDVPIPPTERTALRRALLAWYRRTKRDLPWRQTSAPYAVWLSEIMLQQTRVETVQPYYTRFLSAFPTVEDLAAAPLDRVLKMWEGLGYYSRARNLHAAAQTIVREFDGVFPTTADALRQLPGIGAYTAAAIASIAFGRKDAALDGNIKRVLARLLADETPVDTPTGLDHYWAYARAMLPRASAGDWNQALMDLGARVCVPRRPRCLECPVARWCRAAASGLQDTLPTRVGKKPPVPVLAVAAAVRDVSGRLLLVQRPPRGLLGGMWELPGGEVADGAERTTDALAAATLERLRVDFGLDGVRVLRPLGTVAHAFTHRQLTLQICAARAGGRLPKPRMTRHAAFTWAGPDEVAALALATVDRKALAIVAREFPASK